MRLSQKLASRTGFTLIEVMLALSLFALLGVVLYAAMSLGQGAAKKTEAVFEKNQHLRSVMDLLGSYIRSSYPLRPAPQDASIYYQGEEKELSFISAYSVAMGGRGMAKINLRFDREGEGPGGALTLEEELPANADGGAGAYRNSFTLREGVSDFRLAYLDPQLDKEDWAEKWDGKEKLV
ncbi:MAG: prepilin-type N-terminal cleavage/methylation domain-containing protein [Deltaproteobacteria bacterium]|nr:prepilin-type N-terminal cleavage/methylation domain-containing protein [Deltaproteobacteria bacterium]